MAEAGAMPVAEMSFEAALAELEQVVARLEGGQVALEESIALYARGAELRAHCEERLKAAEARVAEIAQGPDGSGAGPAGRHPLTAMDAETLQFHAVLSQHATRAEAALDGLLPAGDTTLGAAMRHAVLGRRQAAARVPGAGERGDVPGAAGAGAAHRGGGRVHARLQPGARRPALHGRRRPAPRPADGAREVGRGDGGAGGRRAAGAGLRGARRAAGRHRAARSRCG